MLPALTRLQRTALQQFAIAASEREAARRAMHQAEAAMRKAQNEATRHGGLDLPVVAELLTGRFVLLTSPKEDDFLTYVVSPPLFERPQETRVDAS